MATEFPATTEPPENVTLADFQNSLNLAARDKQATSCKSSALQSASSNYFWDRQKPNVNYAFTTPSFSRMMQRGVG